MVFYHEYMQICTCARILMSRCVRMHACVYALRVYVRVQSIKAPLHSPPAVFDLPFKLLPAALQATEVESV